MQSTQRSCRSRRYPSRRNGFTLIELIVALTVISVATTILIRLYMASTDLGIQAQYRELAASVAESQLAQMVSEPANFVWEHDRPDGAGLFRVKEDADDPRAGRKVLLPEVLLPYDASFERQTNVYDKFRWAAYGRVPSAASSIVEVTVDVHWKHAGKTEHIALTGAVPRSKVEPGWAEQ